MKNIDKFFILPHKSILECLKILDEGARQIALVVDEQRHLLGTVTDGDVRRAILRGVQTSSRVDEIMNKKPITLGLGYTEAQAKKIMKEHLIWRIPVMDGEKRVVNLISADRVDFENQPNSIIVMAGGEGQRLFPLTQDIPKPLLQVGDRPILETIVREFKKQGFSNFYFSVNYKAKMIRDYFGDGAPWNVSIDYLVEEKKLGTAGAIGLIGNKPQAPFIVMNGDLLTKLNFKYLVEFHNAQNATATMCVREYEMQIPYGVVEIEDHQIKNIIEKPIHRVSVAAGVYVFNPEVAELIEKDTVIDMPDLFAKLQELGKKCAAYPIRDYWRDIGRHEDLQSANEEIVALFNYQDA